MTTKIGSTVIVTEIETAIEFIVRGAIGRIVTIIEAEVARVIIDASIEEATAIGTIISSLLGMITALRAAMAVVMVEEKLNSKIIDF